MKNWEQENIETINKITDIINDRFYFNDIDRHADLDYYLDEFNRISITFFKAESKRLRIIIDNIFNGIYNKEKYDDEKCLKILCFLYDTGIINYIVNNTIKKYLDINKDFYVDFDNNIEELEKFLLTYDTEEKEIYNIIKIVEEYKIKKQLENF